MLYVDVVIHKPNGESYTDKRAAYEQRTEITRSLALPVVVKRVVPIVRRGEIARQMCNDQWHIFPDKEWR